MTNDKFCEILFLPWKTNSKPFQMQSDTSLMSKSASIPLLRCAGLMAPQCPACLMPDARQHWLKNQRRWQCRDCGKQYSVKVNTIFEDSADRSTNGSPPCGCLRTARMASPATRLARDIGVTQKSAWFMLQRIRLAMKNKSVLKLGYQRRSRRDG